MKFKKALKIIKRYCKDENCYVGICPLACKPKDDERGSLLDCMLDIQLMDSWNVKEINRRVKAIKAMSRGEKALKRGVLPSSVQAKECIKKHMRAH